MKLSNNFSDILQSWIRTWQGNRIDTFRSLLNIFLRERPLFIFLIFYSVRFFNWQSPFIIILGFIVSQLFNEVLSMSEIVNIRLKIIRGYILVYESALPNFKLKKFLLSNYLSKDTYIDINKHFVSMFAGMLGIRNISLDQLVSLYAVDLTETDKISENPTCYSMSLFDSFIFLGYSPDEDTPFQRFSLLHELGHAALSMASFNFFASHALKIQVLFYLFIYTFFDWYYNSWHLLIISPIILLVGFLEQKSVNNKRKLHDEIKADAFAFMYLEDNNIEFIRDNDYLLEYYFDKSLTPKQNAERHKKMKEILDSRINNNQDEIIEIMSKTITKPNFFTLFLYGMLFSLPTFYTFHCTNNLLTVLIVIFLLILILMIFINVFQLFLKNLIDLRLEAHIIK